MHFTVEYIDTLQLSYVNELTVHDISDAAVTSGLGLRWALTGPLMTNTLGGGGDFKHFLDHIGSAATGWLADMDKHPYDFSEASNQKLAEEVESWTKTLDTKALEEERDSYLRRLVKAKAESTYLK